MARHWGARRNWTNYGQNDNIDMGHWAEAQNFGNPMSPSTNNFWGSGPGGMPVDAPGFGALAQSPGDAYRNLSSLGGNSANDWSNRFIAHPSKTVPSIYADPGGGDNNIASQIGRANLGGDWQFGAGRLGADAPWRQELAAKGKSSWLDSLGGWGGIANLGMTGWGLLQNREKEKNLKDYRADLTASRNKSAALDEKKFGLIEEEYGDRKKIRRANIHSQRPQDATTNPYINEVLQQS